MKHIVYALVLSLVVAPALTPSAAFASRDGEISRRERAKTKLERERKEIDGEIKDYNRDLSAREKELKEVESRKPVAKGPKGPQDPTYKNKLQEWERERDEARSARDEARDRVRDAKSSREEYEEKISDLDKEIDRISDLPERRNDDCPDGNCRGRSGAPNQQTESAWSGFAKVLQAATPLGLGAMGLYGAVKGMNLQSSDYRYYNANNTLLGLPSAPPTGYGGLMGSFLGPAMMSSMFMNGMGGGGMFGGGLGLGGGLGFGLGGGLGFGMPFSMGMGFPIAGGMGIGSIFSPMGGMPMGMGMYPMGMGMYPMGMAAGMGFMPMGMGGGMYPMGMAAGMGFAIGSAFTPMGMGMYPMGMGMGGYPMGMAAGMGFAPMGMGMGGYPMAIGIGAGIGMAPMGMGMYPMGMGMGGYPMGMGMTPYAPMGGYGYPVAIGIGGGGAYGVPFGGGGFSPYMGGIGFAAGGVYSPYPTMPYPGTGGGFPGMYPGGGFGYPGVGGIPGSPFGFPGVQSPYANPFYGMNPNGYGGLQGYNPYLGGINNQFNSGGMNAFFQQQQQQAAAMMRQAQQQQILSQDAMTAGQALQEAQNRYSQIMSQMGGSYYMGGSVGYGGAGFTNPIQFGTTGGGVPPLTGGRL